MYCSKCGKEIKDDSIFCYSCGSKVEIKEEQIPVSDYKCNRKIVKRKMSIWFKCLLYLLLIIIIVFTGMCIFIGYNIFEAIH